MLLFSGLLYSWSW